MKQETIQKLKELARVNIIEKDDKIIFVVLGDKKNARTNKKKRTD